MTIEEAMQEMRSHLNERAGPEDWLTPITLWAEPLGLSWDVTRKRINKTTEGQQLLKDYHTARRVREEAYYAALRSASAERLPLRAVSRAFNKSSTSSELIRRLKLKGCKNRLSTDLIHAKAKPGMTLTELAAACGYTYGAIKSWADRGTNKSICTIGKRSTPRGGSERYISSVLPRARRSRD
jgi:hypothetical protein